jgi:hypothetical protein
MDLQSRHTTPRFRVQPDLISLCNNSLCYATMPRRLAVSTRIEPRIGRDTPCAPMAAHDYAWVRA